MIENCCHTIEPENGETRKGIIDEWMNGFLAVETPRLKKRARLTERSLGAVPKQVAQRDNPGKTLMQKRSLGEVKSTEEGGEVANHGLLIQSVSPLSYSSSSE